MALNEFISFNLHCLKHLTELFGNVDNFSAFPFENNVAFFQKSTRKHAKQLQQIYRRYQEKMNFRNINPRNAENCFILIKQDYCLKLTQITSSIEKLRVHL